MRVFEIEPALTEEQEKLLNQRCDKFGEDIYRVWRTDKNLYVKLVKPGQYTETRYWYAARSRKHYSGKIINDGPRWKLVG